MAPRLLALSCSAALLVLSACKKDDEVPSSDPLELLPSELQGVYGRTHVDAPGLVVTPTGLEFRDMKLTIHAGAMEGDTARIERATLRWEKLEPTTCNGTIARQGDRLLLSLYRLDNPQERCESVLDAAWARWEPLDALPELIRGRYGVLLIEPNVMRLDLDWVSTSMQISGLYRLPGSNDERVELLVHEAKLVDSTGVVGDFECSGTMTLEEGKLTTSFDVPPRLVPEIGSEADKDEALQTKLAEHRELCERWSGSATKWTVDTTKLPKKVAKGDISLALAGEQAVFEAPELACTVPIWRTESVSSSSWENDAGTERMTLGKAEPTRVGETCKLKLSVWCERAITDVVASGVDHDEALANCVEDQTRDLCPDRLSLRALSDVRYKLFAGPDNFNEIACVDTTGDFMVAQ